MKIAHLADIHVRLLKYHSQYRSIFQQLYSTLKEKSPDNIVVVGDIAHSKTNVSNEYFQLVTDFLDKLSDIAPTYVVLGNHDLLVKNLARTDSISPIVKALGKSTLQLLEHSGKIELPNSDVVLNVLSLLDPKAWDYNLDKKKINVALYHGPVKDCETDSGWKIDRADMELDTLKKFDFAFLGDIHKFNQSLDEEGRYRYCGSLISQNFSEAGDRGFLFWDIKNKKEFTCEEIALQNPNPFVNVVLTTDGRIPNDLVVPVHARIRLVAEKNLPYDTVKTALELAKFKFDPESVVLFNRSFDTASKDRLLTDVDNDTNLRSMEVQEKLIGEYLERFEITDEIRERVFNLNKKYRFEQDEEEIERNVHWRIKKFEWSNLFNYGEGNKLDFSSLKGVVGIFGKSWTGKSSIIESMLYTIFNACSKNSRKNYNIINQNKPKGQGSVEIAVGDDVYLIDRTSEKYDRKLYGNVTEEAKTVVDARVINSDGEEINLNGSERSETDKNIRRTLGTIDDFLLTSMSSQFGSLAFIDEGSTKRKEILARFLDLEIFDRKFKAAKNDVTEIKAALHRADNIDFIAAISESKKQLSQIHGQIEKQKALCDYYKLEVERHNEDVKKLEAKLALIPVEMVNTDDLLKKLSLAEKRKDATSLKRKETVFQLDTKKDLLSKIEQFVLEVLDIEEYRERKKKLAGAQKEIDELVHSASQVSTKLSVNKKKTDLLQQVPCGSEYRHCKFIKDAYEALDSLPSIEEILGQTKKSLVGVQKYVESLEPEKTNQCIDKYEKLLEKKSVVQAEVAELLVSNHNLEAQALIIDTELEGIRDQLKKHEADRVLLMQVEELQKEYKKRKIEKEENLSHLSECEEQVGGFYKQLGSVEQKITELKERRDEAVTLREQFEAYDLFLRSMHPDGIAYQIIRKKLPYVNSEIAKVLSNIAPFSVFFESDEKRLNINIQHEGFDPRPLELGSGAEKLIASLAIRLALIKVCNLPKSNILILDEPVTGLDSTLLESFSKMLDMLRDNFDTIVLISHLDVLKDAVDNEIVIDHVNKYAYVNQ